MSKKTRGCALGLALGGALRAFIFLIGKLLKGIAWVLAYFGLWIPFLYALGGVGLFLGLKFNPFDGSNDAVLYLVGFGLCCLASVIITVRKLIIKPVKKLFAKKNPEESPVTGDKNVQKADGNDRPKRWIYWKKPAQVTEDATPGGDKNVEAPVKKIAEKPTEPIDKMLPLTEDEKELIRPQKDEKPKIYFSTVEPDTLIHEYHDRFEVFRVIDDRKYLSKVEYKCYDRQ